ncbi:MAG: hypothetical protein HWN67_21520 [Candidatus Helarchaeota archaeon]|nr:hypothetical protein [Candidatus Helarchaeota archaeon]
MTNMIITLNKLNLTNIEGDLAFVISAIDMVKERNGISIPNITLMSLLNQVK